MQTLLLLAGQSKRFWPLAEKSLFPICGKTLVEHQIETLKKAGLKDITLIAGAHNKKELKKLFPGLSIIEQKDLDLGMQGACLSALPKMMKNIRPAGRSSSDERRPVMIISGNDVIEAGAFDLLRKEAAKPKVGGAILARKIKKYFPGGYLTVRGGKITSIIEKPGIKKVGMLHATPRLVNIVAHIHNDPAALLAALRAVKNHRDDGYEQALQSLFREGTYRAVPYNGFWQPVKYPWHLLPLLEHFLSRTTKSTIHSTTKIHPSAVIDGNVVIGEGTRILPHATIVGPCVIGKHCVIGNGALVRKSSIGDDCVIGYNTEVKGSVLAGLVWTHMTYLGDSIIGRNVSFGGGTFTGNLRLDEQEISSADSGHTVPTGLTKLGMVVGDNCRFGIQVAANPGVKIGQGSFIATDTTLNRDVPSGSFVNMKNGIVQIRPNKAAVPSVTQCGGIATLHHPWDSCAHLCG